jgi:hypothetical protein
MTRSRAAPPSSATSAESLRRPTAIAPSPRASAAARAHTCSNNRQGYRRVTASAVSARAGLTWPLSRRRSRRWRTDRRCGRRAGWTAQCQGARPACRTVAGDFATRQAQSDHAQRHPQENATPEGKFQERMDPPSTLSRSSGRIVSVIHGRRGCRRCRPMARRTLEYRRHTIRTTIAGVTNACSA